VEKQLIMKVLRPHVRTLQRNQTKILVLALAFTSASTALLYDGVKEHNKFLKERGLYDAYYDRVEIDS